jgi:hypothetical protein
LSGTPGLIYWALAGSALAAKERTVITNKEGYQILNSSDKDNDDVMQLETCVNTTTRADNDTQ